MRAYWSEKARIWQKPRPNTKEWNSGTVGSARDVEFLLGGQVQLVVVPLRHYYLLHSTVHSFGLQLQQLHCVQWIHRFHKLCSFLSTKKKSKIEILLDFTKVIETNQSTINHMTSTINIFIPLDLTNHKHMQELFKITVFIMNFISLLCCNRLLKENHWSLSHILPKNKHFSLSFRDALHAMFTLSSLKSET